MNKQLEKQNEIIEQSKKLIQNLAQFGDKYTAFSSNIDTNLIKLDTTNNSLENTSNILKTLVDKLENETFDELDLNHDGVITREEFEAEIKKLAETPLPVVKSTRTALTEN